VVGAGKTVVATAVALYQKREITIVLVPPILIRSWVTWLKRFDADVVRFQGTPAVRAKLNLQAKFVVMSHAIFRQDFRQILTACAGRKIGVILDEAQAIKSVQSQLYKKVKQLTEGQNLQMLSGTPTSTPIDAYSYISLKNPTIYRSMGHFQNLHVEGVDFFGKPTKFGNLDLLAGNLALNSVKIERSDLVGQLEGLYPDSSYELSPDHMKLYQRVVEEQLLLFDDGTKIDATTATRLYHALQQVIVNYDYFSGDPTKRSAAYDLLDLALEGQPLIVWAWYKRSIASVLAYLLSKGVKAVAAAGEYNSQRSFEDFMSGKAQVLVASPLSAGAGLNPQSVCSNMLFLELPPSAAVYRQCVGRIVRQGQTTVPLLRVGVALGTIQETALARLLAADDLVSKVELTRDSLRKALLGG